MGCFGHDPADVWSVSSTPEAAVRVLVADDHDVVRVGLVMILDAQPNIQVVGEARTGSEAVTLARRLRPDVCLLDIRMPGARRHRGDPTARRARCGRSTRR